MTALSQTRSHQVRGGNHPAGNRDTDADMSQRIGERRDPSVGLQQPHSLRSMAWAHGYPAP